MKKTLVALAVLAASGASFAQVTLSGEFAYGFLATTDGAGNTASGLGIDTGLLVFSAKEDLGGGYMAEATMKTDSSSGRSNGISNATAKTAENRATRTQRIDNSRDVMRT